MNSIYGKYKPTLDKVLHLMLNRIEGYNEKYKEEAGEGIYEHLSARIKGEQSMREKCDRRGLPQTPYSALAELKDSIGLRIVTNFIDDIKENVQHIKSFPDCEVVEEKDYITTAKSNGYRSYHLIIMITVPWEDVRGNIPGKYYIEIQLRTIAMDTWASLEHQLKYKHTVSNQEMIVSELKRCADELASCDVSMQTIRDLIREG